MKRTIQFINLTVLIILFSSGQSLSQTMWTKYQGNPVLSGEGTGIWDHHVFGPEVLFNDDSSRFEMWYTGSYGLPNWRPYRIGYAHSTDGKTWIRNDISVLNPDPGTWDEATVEYPCVLNENGQYKMWYTGYSISDTRKKIGLATSADGINWIKDTLNNPVLTPGPQAWDAGTVGYCQVLPTATGYEMWYTGESFSPVIAQIGYATSNDGITWTKRTDPVLSPGQLGEWDYGYISVDCVLKIGNIYYLFYVSIMTNLYRIGLATSTDGIVWQKYDDPTTTNSPFAQSDPILTPSPGQWDADYVESASVILKDDSLHLWYGGSRIPTATYLWRIGYATAPVSYHVPTFISTIQGAIDASHDGNIVLVEDGTYYENINFKGKAITVASRFLINEDTSHISNTIIDGNQLSNPDSGSVVYFVSGEDTNSVLTGFTITGGSGTNEPQYTARSGGGIYCLVSGGRIEHNIIRGNSIISPNRSFGGGILADVSPNHYIILNDNIIYNNNIEATFADGGGISIYHNGKSRIMRNDIYHNYLNASVEENVGVGICVQGISTSADTITIGFNKVYSNKGLGTKSSSGGGIGIIDSSPILVNNLFIKNTATLGGGIHIRTMTEDSKTESEAEKSKSYHLARKKEKLPKQAYHRNESILQKSGPILINNTLSENSVNIQGGGLHANNSNPIILNSIIWGNSAPVGPEMYFTGGSTVIVQYSDIGGGWNGTGNIDSDPFFHDSLSTPGDTMYRCLSSGSPCIDTGNPDDSYFDIEDLQNPGYALWPAMGTLRNDMGAYGGHGSKNVYLGIKKKTDKLLISKKFRLNQNYPNPFNPITTIEFDLPKSSEVTLKVFNILGEEVATLVSDQLSAGTYSYDWDASNLASGVYLYRLETEGYVETRKMVLMK